MMTKMCRDQPVNPAILDRICRVCGIFFSHELVLTNIFGDRRRRYVNNGHFDNYYVCAAVSDGLVGGVLSAVERTHGLFPRGHQRKGEGS